MRLLRSLLWSALWCVLLGCAAGAVLLTGLRLVQPGNGTLVRAVSFAPWALPGYAVVLVLGLVLGRSAVRGRRRPLVLPALALVALGVGGLALHGWWLAPYLVGPAPASAAGAQPVRVMTLNALGGRADVADVVRTVAERDVQLLAVQEIEPTTLAALQEAGLRELLPHHAGEPVFGVTGSVLFSAHPVRDVEPIATQWVSFAATTRVAGEQVSVVVTHPESPMGDASGWRADHAALRSALTERSPDLVLGDLNATSDHEPFTELLDTGLRDAAEVANSGWQPTWPSAGKVRLAGLAVPPVLPIDHVLVGRRWTVLATEAARVAGTDHAALVAEVAPAQVSASPAAP